MSRRHGNTSQKKKIEEDAIDVDVEVTSSSSNHPLPIVQSTTAATTAAAVLYSSPKMSPNSYITMDGRFFNRKIHSVVP